MSRDSLSQYTHGQESSNCKMCSLLPVDPEKYIVNLATKEKSKTPIFTSIATAKAYAQKLTQQDDMNNGANERETERQTANNEYKNIALPFHFLLTEQPSENDLADVVFFEHPLAKESNAPVADNGSTTSEDDSDESDYVFLDDPPGTSYATFHGQPDFKEQTGLRDRILSTVEKNKETPDLIRTIFPEGYKNDNGVFNPISLVDCLTSVANAGGLRESQICTIIEQMKVNDNVKREHVYHTFSSEKELPSVSYTIYKNYGHAVLNIERILATGNIDPSDTKKPTCCNETIKPLLEKLAKEKKELNYIQLPVSINKYKREHYVHLQIYKTTNNTIGARLIDSTGNTIGHNAVKEDVNKILNECTDSLASVLSIPETSTRTIETSFYKTSIQPIIGDKHCGIYVMAGICEATKMALRHGSYGSVATCNTNEAIKHITRAHQAVRTCKGTYVDSPDGTDYIKNNCNNVNDSTTPYDKIKITSYEKVAKALENYNETIRYTLFHDIGKGFVKNALDKLKKPDENDKNKVAKEIVCAILKSAIVPAKGSKHLWIDPNKNRRIKCLLRAFGFTNINFSFPRIKLDDIAEIITSKMTPSVTEKIAMPKGQYQTPLTTNSI